MNKETQIRRRIRNTYNKREEDFPSLRDYNDYLEEVEDIVFNLIEGVDVQRTEAKVALYQEENAEAIVAARARQAEEQAAALRSEQKKSVASVPAAVEPAQIAPASTAPGQYAPTMFLPPRPAGQPVPLGPPMLNGNMEPEDEETRKVREERGMRAGGWTFEIGRRRAHEEAFMSVWVT